MPGGDAETVTVIRPPPKGKFGDPAPGVATEFELAGALFAPGGSAEMPRPSNSVDTDADLYFEGNPDTGILPKDQVRVRGKLFEVIGEPAVWGRFGTVVRLRRFTG